MTAFLARETLNVILLRCSQNEVENENNFFFNCPLNLALRTELNYLLINCKLVQN